MNMLHAWMIAQRDLVPEAERWIQRYLDDGAVPIDNNWCENQIRPWALGRKNWLCVSRRRRHDDEMKTAA